MANDNNDQFSIKDAMNPPTDNGAPRPPLNGPMASAGQPQDVAAPYSAFGILGGTGLESMVSGYLQHITEVQANSPLGVKNKAIQDAKATKDATPVDTQKPADTDAPAPAAAGGGGGNGDGSFRSKLSSAVGEVAAGFGDAAHAHDTKGGWLSGVANTLNARNERLAQAKKDDILMAKTQAETIALHRNAFRQSAADAEEFHKGNQHFNDIMDLNHNNVEASFDEVQKKMKDPKFAQEHYVREIASDPQSTADGKPKKDKYGDPVTSPRYTIIDKATKDGSPDTHEVDAAMSAHMENFYGTKMPVGTKLTTGQFVAMDTTMQADRMAVNHLNNGREKPLSADEIKTLRPALTDPTIQAAISHTPGDPYGGVQEQISNGNAQIDDYQKQMKDAQASGNQDKLDWAKGQLAGVQEEHEKLKQFAADAFTNKQVNAFDKKSEDFGTTYSELQKKSIGASGEQATGIAATTKAMLDDPTNNYTTAQKKQLGDLVTQNLAVAKADEERQIRKEDREAASKEAIKKAEESGDVSQAADLLRTGNMDPSQLSKRAKSYQATLNEADRQEMAETGKHFDIAKAQTDYKYANNVGTQNTLKYLNSLTGRDNKSGNLGELVSQSDKINRTEFPPINNAEAWAKINTGDSAMASYYATVTEVADQVAKILQGGGSGSGTSDAKLVQAQELFNQKFTKDQVKGISVTLRTLLGNRKKEMVGDNRYLLKDFPQPQEESQQPTKSGQQTSAGLPANAPKGAIQRPSDLPKATGFGPGPDGKTLYWHDAAGNGLRKVNPGETPDE